MTFPVWRKKACRRKHNTARRRCSFFPPLPSRERAGVRVKARTAPHPNPLPKRSRGQSELTAAGWKPCWTCCWTVSAW
ncbi:hypothetical protein AOY62_17515 [Escherichia coli]|nr:hypothetical protein AOY62_17515 [Escherichia coli]